MRSSFRNATALVVVASISLASFYMLAMPGAIFPYEITIAFEDIDKGYYCGIDDRRSLVILDNETWNNLWTDLHNRSSSVPDLPAVNFSSEVVIAIFQGECQTGGYDTTISRVTQAQNGLNVYIDESHPDPNCGTTQALTQPYHIVKIQLPLQSGGFQYHYNVTTYTC
ncbi:MAG: protease complex subunit PrcB family protein [Candidatus Thorarchaeota archaeon]